MPERRAGTCKRKGFALPMAVLAMALVTAAVIAAYASTSAEVVANNAMRAQHRAQHNAEVGLQQFLLRRGEPGFCTNCVTEPAYADSEWTRVPLPGGYADVTAMRVRPRIADLPSLFFVRSRGVDTTVRLSGAGGAVFATRVVGQYASFGTAGVRALAAFTSFNGVTNTATRTPANGNDACGYIDRQGMIIPQGSVYRGGGTRPYPGVDSTQNVDSLKRRVGIDWEAIALHNALPADVIMPTGPWPSFADPNYWPVIRVTRNFTVPTSGRGLIIADSNLTLNVDYWDGIILVGGRITLGGVGDVRGEVVTGLNRLLPGGMPSAATDSLRNSKQVQYDICRAFYASERLRVYFAMGNAWVDNIAIW